MSRWLTVVVAVALAGCHGSHGDTAPPGSNSAKKSELLSHVPADTPYLFATIEAPPKVVLEKLYGPLARQFATALHDGELGSDTPAAELTPIQDALKGVTPDHYWDALGFAPGGRFVIYGLGVWPVARIELTDAVKLRGIADKVFAAAKLEPHDVQGHAYWTKTYRKMTVVLAILDHELVAALVPPDEVDPALPVLLGLELPTPSLNDVPTIPNLLSSHKFLPTMFGYADPQRIIDVASGRGTGKYDALVGHRLSDEVAPCHDDFAFFASWVPRVTMGYTQLDGNGVAGQVAFETTPVMAAALMALHADGPALPPLDHILGAMSVAIDVDAANKWHQANVLLLHAHHFSCKDTQDLNDTFGELASHPHELPAELRGMRGTQIVIEDANLSPPSGKGTVTVIGAHLQDTLAELLAKVSPDLARLHIVADGSPISLPVSEMGVPYFSSAHLALKGDRLVAAVGDASAQRAMAALATPSVHAPLLAVGYNSTLVRQRLSSLFDDSKPSQASAFSQLTIALDANQSGLVMDLTGQWAH